MYLLSQRLKQKLVGIPQDVEVSLLILEIKDIILMGVRLI
jgi:hypothetical protein